MTVCGVHGCREVASGSLSRMMLGKVVAFLDAASLGEAGTDVEVAVPLCRSHFHALSAASVPKMREWNLKGVQDAS